MGSLSVSKKRLYSQVATHWQQKEAYLVKSTARRLQFDEVDGEGVSQLKSRRSKGPQRILYQGFHGLHALYHGDPPVKKMQNKLEGIDSKLDSLNKRLDDEQIIPRNQKRQKVQEDESNQQVNSTHAGNQKVPQKH